MESLTPDDTREKWAAVLKYFNCWPDIVYYCGFDEEVANSYERSPSPINYMDIYRIPPLEESCTCTEHKQCCYHWWKEIEEVTYGQA